MVSVGFMPFKSYLRGFGVMFESVFYSFYRGVDRVTSHVEIDATVI